MDVMVWNVVFLLVNFMHFFYLVYKRRPVSSAPTQHSPVRGRLWSIYIQYIHTA